MRQIKTPYTGTEIYSILLFLIKFPTRITKRAEQRYIATQNPQIQPQNSNNCWHKMCKLLQNGFVFLFILNIIHRRLKKCGNDNTFQVWGRWVIALSSPRKIICSCAYWFEFSIFFFAIYSRHLWEQQKSTRQSHVKVLSISILPQMFCLMFEQNNKFMLGTHKCMYIFFTMLLLCIHTFHEGYK